MPPTGTSAPLLLPTPSAATPSPTATSPPHSQDAVLHNVVSSSTSSPCCRSTPNAVLLDLHTTLVIPDYHLYYSGPISAFHPDYHALGDGSLVATPLIADIRSANVQLGLMSALAMFFLVSTMVSLQYLRRGKVKRKLLFYLFFISQVSGLASIVTIIIPSFNQFVSCTRYVRLLRLHEVLNLHWSAVSVM